MVTRNIKQDRKGNILIASFNGIFRYDGKSFTNITSSKISSPASFRMFWKIDAEIFGSLLLIQVFIITMGNPFKILQPGKDLLIITLVIFMKIKPVIFGSVPVVE